MTGKVFTIEEFATFDGPGIRMTVFMKGCPLRCTWCHNPEGQSLKTEYLRSPNGCLGCKRCEKIVDGKITLTADSVAACPRSLVRACGIDYTVDELLDKIARNATVLKMNGGGVTFSGGEPLMQADYVLECITRLKGSVHTALQTCGYTDSETFNKALAVTDYFLYDLKIMDDTLHRDYCGVSNNKILANYKLLASSGVPFVTRIPLIPTVVDSEENIAAIARFISDNGVTYAELLPYNRYAGSKYAGVLKEYRPRFDESVPPNPHQEIFARYGVKTKIM